MKAALDLDEFLSCPVGHYFEASTFVYWYPQPEVSGLGLRDCPTSEDIVLLTRVIGAVFKSSGGPHVSLIDARRLSYVQPAAFTALVRYLEQHWRAFNRSIRRQALVRPVGLAGTIVAGFYDVLRPSYPTHVFENVDDALAWLGSGESDAVRTTLSEFSMETRRVDPLLAALRRLLDRTPKVTVSAAARVLAVSERSLQRSLHASGTTFQAEVRDARVRASQRLMLASEANLTTIALEVGCASLQHYSSLFRSATGVSPSTWRKRHAMS